MRHKYATGQLPAQRVTELEDAGFAWRPSFTLAQTRYPDAARSWHRLHGHLGVPHSGEQDGLRLGNWLHQQRRAHAAGTLNEQSSRHWTHSATTGTVPRPAPPRIQPDRRRIAQPSSEAAWRRDTKPPSAITWNTDI
ncbi:hypothetical protein GCM10010289_75480 [Streptomyces violascens]|nr:hypothetical protein GCM10010289_75480 [Streptomyces violascens]